MFVVQYLGCSRSLTSCSSDPEWILGEGQSLTLQHGIPGDSSLARAFESKHGHLLLRGSSRSSIEEPAIERVPNADGDEGYRLSVDAEPTSSVEQRNESKVTEAFANFDRHSIASK
ncbi:hypothetical protein RND71_043793 [Anisodus tanguticus]|uniref:Uncharacterized protein n=1 Tax=Anisodus tanguticus TaxID=243964 RepID=A0AAE1URR4_9SOLA|nr:hypothetical protein RND71_043793 [Anisodus tanguticus]